MVFAASQQVWAGGHLHCDEDEMDLCDNDTGDGHDHDHDHKDDHGSTGKSFKVHMFEGGGCATAEGHMAMEINKCTSMDSIIGKMVEKDASTIYMMLGAAGCTEGAGEWGTGHALDCKNDGSECCNLSMDGGNTIMASYKVEAPAPTPTPAATPSPTPAPAAPEAADTASGQAPAVLLASAVAGVGALLLEAA